MWGVVSYYKGNMEIKSQYYIKYILLLPVQYFTRLKVKAVGYSVTLRNLTALFGLTSKEAEFFRTKVNGFW